MARKPMARPRQAKPKRSYSETQEIEELEQRLAQLDPAVASADGQEGEGGALSVQSGSLCFVCRKYCLYLFAAPSSAVETRMSYI